ncbi:MAG: tRNA pseudouridine(13) synthase TruD [Planctomycetes bacterium]|nr:tRNA pseudouridine(13) synthase TruD [Planctomycetota bacterium]
MLPFLTAFSRPSFAGARVKARPEDFVVEELALYEPSGTGTHAYLWIEKRGQNTHDAVRRIAKVLGKRDRDAGVAGLKDAQAVTRQWISFEHVEPDKLARLDAAALGPGLQILHVSRHGNKLKMGHLKGNRFVIRLRFEAGAAPAGAANTARAVLSELQRRGVPNYYGEQRFGRGAGNVGLGRLLVQGDEAAFTQAFAASGNNPARARDGKFRNLLVNAFQAELFNQVLARRMPELGKFLPGDLALLHRNGAVFKIEDAAAAEKEQPRADAFELSPSGPLYGPKTPLAEGEPGRIEREVLAASGVSVEDFGRKEAERQPGARRALRIPLLEAPEVSEDAEGLVLKFALPSGAYATVVLRELLGDAQE